VPNHRRLAISRLRVPNLDGSVPTAAGNLLSIGAPRHREDPEIVRIQDTNQQKQREKNREKLTRPSARSAAARKRTILCTLDLYSHNLFVKKG